MSEGLPTTPTTPTRRPPLLRLLLRRLPWELIAPGQFAALEHTAMLLLNYAQQ